MNRFSALLLLSAVMVTLPVQAQTLSARQLLDRHAASVVRVEAVVEYDFGEMADMMGMAPTQQTTLQSVAVVVDDRHVAVQTSGVEATAPPFALMGPDGGPEIGAELKSIHVVLADGTKLSATVVSKITGSGASLLRVESKRGVELKPVDMKTPSGSGVGDDIVAIARMSKRFDLVARIERGYLSGDKPTKAGLLQQGIQTSGCAVFDRGGRFVGMTVRSRARPENPSMLLSMMPDPSDAPVVIVSAKRLAAALPRGEKPVAPKPSGPTSEAFESADADDSGSVSEKEFTDYAAQRLQGQDDAFFKRFFKLVDANSNGKLDTAEFEKRMEALQKMRSGGDGGEGAGADEEQPRRRRRRPDPGPRDLDDKEGDYDKVARRAVARDSFPVLDEPDMTPAAKSELEDDESVIGVVCDGEARAYPIAVMGRHELANDICGDTPIAVSW